MSKTDTSTNGTTLSSLPKAAEKPATPPTAASEKAVADTSAKPRPKEIGGPKGPEPTRFGDWERDGRCVDF